MIITQNQRLAAIFTVVAILLTIPMIAMQFSSEVDWSVSDFIIAGILLGGIGLMIELVLRKVKKTTYRLALCGLVLLIGFLIWAELAVGVFGSPFAGS